jgi:hypothetical protein
VVTTRLKEQLSVGEFVTAVSKDNHDSQLEINALMGGYSKRIQHAYEGIWEWCLLSDGGLSNTAMGKLVGEFAKQWHLLPTEVMSLQLYEFTETLYINSGGKYDRWQQDSSESDVKAVALSRTRSTKPGNSVEIAQAVHEWAMSKIPDAEAMTIEELFNAIQSHPDMQSKFLDRLPNNWETFGTYLRRAGIHRYNKKGDRMPRPSRRPRK